MIAADVVVGRARFIVLSGLAWAFLYPADAYDFIAAPLVQSAIVSRELVLAGRAGRCRFEHRRRLGGAALESSNKSWRVGLGSERCHRRRRSRVGTPVAPLGGRGLPIGGDARPGDRRAARAVRPQRRLSTCSLSLGAPRSVTAGAVSPSQPRVYISCLLSLSRAEIREAAARCRCLFSISLWHLATSGNRSSRSNRVLTRPPERLIVRNAR